MREGTPHLLKNYNQAARQKDARGRGQKGVWIEQVFGWRLSGRV